MWCDVIVQEENQRSNDVGILRKTQGDSESYVWRDVIGQEENQRSNDVGILRRTQGDTMRAMCGVM